MSLYLFILFISISDTKTLSILFPDLPKKLQDIDAEVSSPHIFAKEKTCRSGFFLQYPEMSATITYFIFHHFIFLMKHNLYVNII